MRANWRELTRAIAVCGLLPASALAQPPTLTDLAAGGQLEISFESRGCFHHELRDFIVFGGPSHRVRVGVSNSFQAFAPEGGTVILTARDWDQFDAYLVHLRSRLRGYCTTQDTLRLVWSLPTGSIYKEHFIDSSCPDAVDAQRKELGPRLLLLGEVAARLETPTEHERRMGATIRALRAAGQPQP